MADIYCDKNGGNDTTGDGSIGNPYATRQKAVDNAGGGDTIYISNDGAQTDSIDWTTGWGGGTSDTVWLHFKPYDSGGSFTYTLPDGTVIDPAFEVDGGDSLAQPHVATSIPGNVHVEHGYFHNFTTRAMHTGIEWHVHQCRLSHSPDGSNTANNCQYTENWVHDMTDDGLLAGAENILKRNYIDSCTGDGIHAGGHEVRIRDNIIRECTGHGINVTSNWDSVEIIGNTIDGTGSAASDRGIKWSSSHGFAHCYNNIISNYPTTGAYGQEFSATGHFSELGPNFYYNVDTKALNTPSDVNVDRTASDVTEASDPFTNRATGDYTIKSGSTFKAAAHGFADSYEEPGALQREEPAGGGGSDTGVAATSIIFGVAFE